MQRLVESRFRKRTLAAPDRILVATDLTDTEYLLSHVIAQARSAGADVTLVHAIPPLDIAPMAPEAIPYIDRSKVARDARVMLLGVARQIEALQIACDIAVREGEVSDVVHEQLRRTNATRLILGTHGRGKLGQLVLGSIAQDLIANVKIPVFAVGPHTRDAAQHATPRKILHPVSLMGDYGESVNLAIDLAQTYRAELTLLHVLDRDVAKEVNPERTLAWAKNALASLAPDGTKLGPPVHTIVTTGKLADEILKAAAQTNVDWIVLGADGEFRSWPFNESAAYKVLIGASCPVLSIRHEPSRTGAGRQHVAAYDDFAPSITRP